jgi:prepilin peptidase CpaA
MLIIAAWQDVRFRLISNRIVIIGAISGLLLSSFPEGQGVVSAVKASLTMFLSFFVLYLVGWLGAGDVKLSGAIGLYFSEEETIGLSLLIMIFGGAFCLIWSLFMSKSVQPTKYNTSIEYKNKIEMNIPYALCICFGVLFYLLMKLIIQTKNP